jgi:hypothetical protein
VKIASALAALLVSAAPMAANAKAPDTRETVSDDTAPGVAAQHPETTLELSWDQPMSPAKEEELKKSLEDATEATTEATTEVEGGARTFIQHPNGHHRYPVVKCSDPNRTFTDRNGRFDVRYNCRVDKVNWRFKVSRKLVAIADGNMKETGMVWYTGTRKLGQNSNHDVPVDYPLHGTQGGMKDGDILHWHDTLIFRVNVGGNTGTAHLGIGGTFKVSR